MGSDAKSVLIYSTTCKRLRREISQNGFRRNGSALTTERTMEPTYEVVWPRSPRGVQNRRVADRLESADERHPLEGKRIAFLWDYLFRGDELLPVLERELTGCFSGLEVVGYEEFGSTHGSDEAVMIAGLPAALANRHIDAVVSAMGC